VLALGIGLGIGVEASAEIYLWTDERGVVHMTNQWANVPESARAHVSVRESMPPSSEGTPAMEPAPRPVEPGTFRQPPLEMSPDLAQTPPTGAPSLSVVPYPHASSMLIPSSRPFVRHRQKVSPPFPYNVRLDAVDPNVVWVDRSRVPKDSFTYPRVSLDTQAQFRNRIWALEQRRSGPQKTLPAKPARP
jgi:Domain of unknown function (DUF4124)